MTTPLLFKYTDTLHFMDSPTDYSRIGQNLELVNLLKDLPKFNKVDESISFELIGEGNSGKIYIFDYEGKHYGIKYYKKVITYKIPEINDNSKINSFSSLLYVI